MRLIALEAGLPGSFSPGGSFEVVLFGAIVGTPTALVFFSLRQRWRKWSPGIGMMLGLLMFAGFLLFPPESARSALAGTADRPAVTALLFALLLSSFGALLEFLVPSVVPLEPKHTLP